MKKEKINKVINQRKYKISGLFVFLFIAISVFLLSVLKTISTDRNIPRHNTKLHDRAFRGNIISEDNYTLSSSLKTYQAVIRGESIAPGKKELFIKLFSIYSGIDEKEVRKKFKDRKGREIKKNIVLSRDINARHAMQLKTLAYKLRKLDVFQSTKTRSGIEVMYGLDIIENGESRRFPLKDVLSPILGYVGKKEEHNYIRPRGKKGLERNYEKYITAKKDGYFQGKRDVSSRIIHDKNSIKEERIDGMDLHLNVPLTIQRRAEVAIDGMKEQIDADEILVGIMESKTGKVLALASTERYDPSHIRQKDIPALNPKFAEYPYEAGSVLKPITLAIALDHNYVTPNTWFNTYNGKMKIGKGRTITDDDRFDSLTTTDIIVHSSNVGISQVSWRLTGTEFREGLIKFGIAKPSGIDLSRDLPGQLKPLRLLNNKMHRANSSYGYGMLVTFAQLFKAYSAFNNDGVAVTPRLVNYLEDAKGNHYTLKPKVDDLHPIGKKAANQIHNILLEVVKRGTGVAAQYPGLEIGGKTGTAHIAKHGRYVREYHSSFYGFANDKFGHKYTIGVLVIRAKKYHKYFASQSAVPTFRRIVDILVELDYLEPEGGVEVPSPQIKEPSTLSLPLVAPKKKSKPKPKVTNKREPHKNKSVKSLFKNKPKVKKESKPKPKSNPVKNRSAHELFDDLF